MKLHWSPKSPYVRKVMIAAHELGLAERLTLVRSVAVMSKINPDIMADNPLGKIPTLVLDDGMALYDSRVICEYLDALGGGVLFPAHGPERWQALAWQGLGDGLLDTLILWRNEREKPEQMQTAAWLTVFAAKLEAGLTMLEARAAQLGATPFNIGHVSLGCMLSYLDFRFDALGWRNGHPQLTAWHAEFCARPSVLATEVHDG
jgi:glutathione S-transferase